MLPKWFYEERAKGKRQARMMLSMRSEQISVDTFLGGFHYLVPDERCDETAYKQTVMLRPFRRAYGERRVGTLTALEAQAWTLEHPSHVRLLRTAWGAAVRMHVAPVDIWAGVVKPKRTKETPRPPTHEELQEMLFRCQELALGDRLSHWWPQFQDFVLVAAYTGARRGGMIPLRQVDVDLDSRRMIVTEKGEKTRPLVLLGPAQLAMERQFARRRREGWQQKRRYNGTLLWVARRRGRVHHNVVQSSWQSIRGDFPYGIHSLKHFASTWLAEQGVEDRDIAIQLGHTDAHGRPYTKLVERVYSHADPNEALRRIEARLQDRGASMMSSPSGPLAERSAAA